jgi:hypothetical protein
MSLNKKTFVLRINNDSFDALSKWADDEFRSVNGQIEMILDKALKEAGRKKTDPAHSKVSEKKQSIQA